MASLSTGQVLVADGVQLYYEHRKSEIENQKLPTENLLMITGAFVSQKLYAELAFGLIKQLADKMNLHVVTFDNRGMGKSGIQRPVTKFSMDMLSDDAIKVADKVFGESEKFNIYGASMGGMIAQHAAVKLIKAKRLRSCYLAVTSNGSSFRPFSVLGVGPCSFLLSLFLKKSPEKNVKDMLIPEAFGEKDMAQDGLSKEQLEELRKKYQELWMAEYDDWFCYNRTEACGAQCTAMFDHYLKPDEISLLSKSGVPIGFQVSTNDKVIAAKKQHDLADSLEAKKDILPIGHMTRSKLILESLSGFLEKIASST